MTDKPYATGGIVPGGKPVIVGTGMLGHTDVAESPSCTGGVVPLSGPILFAGPEMFLSGAGTCKGCKHWKRLPTSDEDPSGHLSTHDGGNVGECQIAHWTSGGSIADNDAAPCSMEEAHLVTGPDFGCVRWERKE